MKGDVKSILKSLQDLQQENKKLEGQIQTLSINKEELELLNDVPYDTVENQLADAVRRTT